MKYFSMFSGIGGFEYGIEQAWNSCIRTRKEEASGQHGLSSKGSKSNLTGRHGEYERWKRLDCIGYSEINKYAKAIYKYHYPEHRNYGNAKDIIPGEIEDFDLLVGGFPCQAFSIAGKRGGFDDTRGTLFFDVARVLKAKRPDWFLLENVKGLCSHDSGKTLSTIYGVLTNLDYTVGWEVVNSCKFGVPQNRERVFIVGHITEAGGCIGEILPVREKDHGVNEGTKQAPIARTFTAGGNSGGFHSSMTLLTQRHYYDENDDRKLEVKEADLVNCLRATGQSTDSGVSRIMNGKNIRRLTPTECERLQGFPDGWTAKGIMDGEEVEISDTQRYKALGNAVTVNVIEAIMEKIFKPKQTELLANE